MSNKPNQKLKLLYVLKMLLEQTDDSNGVSTQDIIAYLATHNIDAERKSVNRDIKTLREFGIDVCQRCHKYWYLDKRPLELQEMIMLVDAVQSASFLTDKMTDSLIDRIKLLASIDQRKMLQRRIEVPKRIKMHNDNVFLFLDVIQQAMRKKMKLEFEYFNYDLKKRPVKKRDGKTYVVSPVRLIFANEFYYLIGFDDAFSALDNESPFRIYRVDRMMGVRLSKDQASSDKRIKKYETSEHISPEFGLFSADKVNVVLEIDKAAMNPVVDKFGLKMPVYEKEGDRARVHIKAPLSPQFYGWLLQLGPLVKIISPKRAVDEFAAMLARTQKMYRSSYRICSDTARRLITQEQFLELVEYLRATLKKHIILELGADGFQNQNDFDDFVMPLMDEWLFSHGIDDGLVHPTQEEIEKLKSDAYSGPMNFDHMLSYGQIVGEVFLALNPRDFAAKDAKDKFKEIDIENKEFRYELIPTNGLWYYDKAKNLRRHKIKEDAFYEIRYKQLDKKNIMQQGFFIAPKLGIKCREVIPWGGTDNYAGTFKGIQKHWQGIAYRFI